MNLTVLALVWNEEFLMPYFMRHYSFADRIHVIVADDTTDRTEEILKANPKVSMDRFHMLGIDDDIKKDKTNEALRRMPPGWVLVVDGDEFLFRANGDDMRSFLERQACNVVVARMWQVYRHRTDADLSIDGEMPVYQRRHGDPRRMLIKPCVVRVPFDGLIGVGNHTIMGAAGRSGETEGVHWHMADPCLAAHRRLSRASRFSENNKRQRMGYHNYGVTEESLMAECSAHMDDPRLF